MNQELPDIQAGFRKGRGTRDQVASIHWIMEKGKEFQKISTSISLTMKVDHNKLENSYGMGLPDHLTCLLRNLYARQEVTIRTGHGTTDGFKIEKGVQQGCISSLYFMHSMHFYALYFYHFYAQYIMRNARLGETQAGIKIARRNINNLRYADDTTFMAESEELKSLLMKVKEESEKAGLKSHTLATRHKWLLIT